CMGPIVCLKRRSRIARLTTVGSATVWQLCMFPAMNTKAQSQPKQTNLNHFVSRFTSRPWLMGTNRFYKLWIEKATVQATPVGPKNWGSEEGLYSQDVEDALEKIETKLARLQR